MKRFLNFMICMVLVFSFLVSCNKDPGKQDAGQGESKGAESETGEEDSPNLIEIAKDNADHERIYLDPCGADIFHLEPGDSVWCKIFWYVGEKLFTVQPAMVASIYRHQLQEGEKKYIEIYMMHKQEFKVWFQYDFSTGEWS